MVGLALGAIACGESTSPRARATESHSSSIAVGADDLVYVVNADADSVSILDPNGRSIVAEIALGPAPAVAPDGSFAPAVQPRALALSVDGGRLYVTGQRANAVFAIDLATYEVRSAPVCSEPIGVIATTGTVGDRVFVACSQDAAVVELTADLVVRRTIAVAQTPWALAVTADGTLAVSHLLVPTLTLIDVTALETDAEPAATEVAIPDAAPRGDKRLAHGQPRGLYDVAPRPGSAELWVPHLLLATDTAQPELDFESTVFPAVSIVGGGSYHATLSTDALDLPGIDGAFADIVSGPHAIAFTPDGAIALAVDTNSEDILAIDATRDVQAALLRPLPGHMPEGLAIAPSGDVAYIDQRNTNDIAVVRIERDGDAGVGAVRLSVETTLPRVASDPMPEDLRFGQHLFYSANSDELPITRNHWVACASCHVEGRTDAVTWRFAQGPRDTPSNAGGTRGTGFLLRTADRTRVQDYFETIDVEQGGGFDPVIHATELDAIAAYVDRGIPLPRPPTTDPGLVARGRELFERADVGCVTCHDGPRFTDSGKGNATLDLGGEIRLHDVGTCAGGEFPDAAHADIDGHPREACLFDTPSLSGLASSAPYLHDGRAATIRDALVLTRGKMGDITMLSDADLDALVEYLRSL